MVQCGPLLFLKKIFIVTCDYFFFFYANFFWILPFKLNDINFSTYNSLLYFSTVHVVEILALLSGKAGNSVCFRMLL